MATVDPPPIQHAIAERSTLLTPTPWALWFQRLKASTEGGAPAFGVVSVSGADDVVATSPTDTVILVAGSNTALETNALAKSVMIRAVPAGHNEAVQFNKHGVFGADDNFTYTESLTRLVLSGAYTDPTTNNLTLGGGATATPTGDSTGSNQGLEGDVVLNGPYDYSGPSIGVYGTFDHEGTGDLSNFAIGVEGDAYNSSSGQTLNTLCGVSGVAGSFGSGHSVRVVGVNGTVWRAGTGTMDAAIRFHASNEGGSGSDTITTTYGLKVEDVTSGGTNYAIHTGAGDVLLAALAAPSGQTYTVVVDDTGLLSSQAGGGGGGGNVSTGGTLTADQVIVGAGGTDIDVLPAGTDGDVLTMVSGTPTWQVAANAFWTTVIAASDQDIASSTTLTDDAELFFTMAAGQLYEFEAFIVYGSPAGGGTPDIKYAWNGPATLSGLMQQQIHGYNTADSPTGYSSTTIVTVNTAGTATTPRATKMVGWAYSTTGGTGTSGLIFQWAQNTSGLNATRRYAGSVLRYRQMTS